jgi:hypothetical protein
MPTPPLGLEQAIPKGIPRNGARPGSSAETLATPLLNAAGHEPADDRERRKSDNGFIHAVVRRLSSFQGHGENDDKVT